MNSKIFRKKLVKMIEADGEFDPDGIILDTPDQFEEMVIVSKDENSTFALCIIKVKS